MFAFRQELRKLGVRVGILASASAVIFAIATVSAGNAMATGPPVCPNAQAIAGEGSSLQKIAQTEVWTVKYNEKCGNKPKVTYTSTSSGSGLAAFRFTGTGTVNKSFAFIGTDDGPNAAQIANAEAAAGTKPIIIPVTQTAIAVVIHPPTGCKFEAGAGITFQDLNKVFGGNGITNWNQFTNIVGGAACNKAITRVVRAEGSGTTYQFKNYLSSLETTEGAEGLPCATEAHNKWAELREVGAGNKPNITWPACAGGTAIVTAAGGGAVAETVAANAGDIGYASLPDAKAKGAEAASLQNGIAAEEPTYAEPGNSTTKTARCVNARYTVPAAGRGTTGTGVAVDWSEVFGAQPTIGGVEYPLCTLTYDVAWLDYTLVGYTSAAEVQAAVKDYLENYVTTAGANGQSDLAAAGKWYSSLPTGAGPGSASDVQEAAELAAMRIGTGTEGQIQPGNISPESLELSGEAEKTITVTNNGEVEMTMTGVEGVGLTNAEIKSNGCTTGTLLKPKGTCTFKLRSTSKTAKATGAVKVKYDAIGLDWILETKLK